MAVWEAAFFTTLNCLPMIIGCCANFLVIVSSLLFISVRDIEGTNLFLVSLSVADFLVCAVYQPLLIIRFNQPDQARSFVLTTCLIGYSLVTVSMNGLLAVTFDRFVAIYLPFKYITWMNKKNVALLISISWLVAFVAGNLALSEIFGVKVISQLYTTIIIMAVPTLYGVIYKEARKQAEHIVNHSMLGAKDFRKRRHLQADRTTRGVGLVLITTMSCWLPVLLFPFFSATLKSDEDFLRGKLWCITAACVNSCINLFIYFYKFAKFRRNVRKLFREIQRKLGDSFLRNTNKRGNRISRKVQDRNQIGTSRRMAWLVNES
ncbi:adenosine receptor A2b-like [Orbicella faveolata]|uniref:adenosine receptor A2b-like n=1 Tax=Orbicella faveolata TaxID=48498 RepID=UPI0009E33BF4|nr:adenosine receptor A2b-like [Orbicella faveolata]